MQITTEKLPDNKVVLEVIVDAERVAASLNTAFRKMAAKVNVPGFRRGKVPRQVFEARFGVESLYEDAIDDLLPVAYRAALEETKLEPIDRPDVDVVQFAKGQEAKLRFTVELMPEIEVKDYRGVEVTKVSAEVSESEVEAELKKLQERHSRLVNTELPTAQSGDTVIIDYRGSVSGVDFAGGTAERQTLVLGSGSFIPGFEEQIVGMARDEERDIEVTFPVEYRAEHLAGQQAVFKVKLHETKRKELPALDDDFAKELSDFESLTDFVADLRQRLELAAAERAKTKLENTVIEKVVAGTEVVVPKVMAEREIDSMVEDMTHSLQRSGMQLPQYLERVGMTNEQLRAGFADAAAHRVKTRLILEKIGAVEGIEVSEQEIDEYVAGMSSSMGRDVAEVRQMLVDRGQLDAVGASLRTGKTVDFLVREAKIL